MSCDNTYQQVGFWWLEVVCAHFHRFLYWKGQDRGWYSSFQSSFQALSVPFGNRTSPLDDKMISAPVYIFLQDPVNITKFCITKIEARLKGTLGLYLESSF
jgi:hypothetical protein